MSKAELRVESSTATFCSDGVAVDRTDKVDYCYGVTSTVIKICTTYGEIDVSADVARNLMSCLREALRIEPYEEPECD